MPPALDPLTTTHRHVKEPEATGHACLAMALEALVEPRPWEQALENEEIPEPSSAEDLALAALRQGLHARLHTQRLMGAEAEPARAAGLLHVDRAPAAKDLERALEAAHPSLVATSHAGPRADEPGPRWILVLSCVEDGLAVHDPLRSDGPDPWDVDDAAAMLAQSPRPALLELGPPSRDDD